ncbi:MAG: hypothetical protein UR39_C0011G0028 [Candidatus Woesebacteria bacterium GW2011_GWA1_33_30]|uniref:Protein containing DUF497 n=1 Tax=Candidatus Woesebacteria bacterium GW2011_GWA2_33_28 TaxID=1618561 RepID=A0A0G0A580_9BACT|nr:MAG: hypothetical protein UR38_C0011G0026 [Candidatus Woesebacteria bacterium GW2011_GWA2_33_28]KKP47076.1 MAG: hypothetical protein UR39_C0011G0028 [Candidatus Woesebacteria bacterium GW2011_GWA1_33_30]KKP48690.1 MAG: hypothetical protein UR40_C0012G0026 [Microgenomates group bacterium GW2011_GWC1_33_32]KKP51399.1 MAG: hypothetical protein UR44_C0011G0026 [Candidatus Woesebacteria bacterium GW2011_GWB1_33_38]KKP57438.1 MAG: hypothetical protein UR48_C0017G0011 [Microgenomates group bacteriu
MEEFDWDEGNKNKNWLKHGVTIKECEKILLDKPVIAKDPKHSLVEVRYSALGKTSKRRFLSILFTIRDNKVRVISARDMSKKEKIKYEKNKKNI